MELFAGSDKKVPYNNESKLIRHWRQRHAAAGARPRKQLGLHGHGRFGLEPQSLVRPAHAQQEPGRTRGQNGIPLPIPPP